MRTTMYAALLLGCAAAAALAQDVRLISATPFGDDGRAEAVTFGPDGTLYVVGRSARPLGPIPAGLKALDLAEPAKGWTYGRAFVARFSGDGKTLLGLATFADGACLLTSVAAGPGGVYVGGYASEAMEPLVAPHGGLRVKGDWSQRQYRLYTPSEHHDEPRRQDSSDQRGVPMVLRFDAALTGLQAATLLEGWQSTWHVPRPLREDVSQPTLLGLLDGGDVVVCHDGGYAARPAEGEAIGFEHFYYVPDHVSRLSADLKQRRWHVPLQMPPGERDRIQRNLDRGRNGHFGQPKITWKHDSIGQTRPFRMAIGPDGRIVLAGWSASRTSQEPWWTPFCVALAADDGKQVFAVYTPDPMSGGGERLGGLVSDAAVRSVAFDADGNLLISGIGDGGNSVLRQDPRDYTRPAPALKGGVHSFPGRVLFWGMVGRIDSRSGELLGGTHFNAWRATPRGQRLAEVWATDLGPWPDGAVLTIGRQTQGFATTDNAWSTGDRGAFVRLYGRDFSTRFSANIPGAALMDLAVHGRSAAAVGWIESDTPLSKAAPLTPGGGRHAYLMILEAAKP